MSVYRRGAIYWWCRRLKLGSPDPRSIILRISLKTSDKAEARSRALALDIELKMVALRYPRQTSQSDPQAWRKIYKDALEWKRDHIADIQSTPPFDDAYNLRYNDAHARIFKLLAQSGIAPVERDLFEAEMADPTMTPDVRKAVLELAECYGLSASTDESHARGPANFDPKVEPDLDRAPTKAAISPRRIRAHMQDVGIAETPQNFRKVLAIIAAGYVTAFEEANRLIVDAQSAGPGSRLPMALRSLLGDTSSLHVSEAPPERNPEPGPTQAPVAGQPPLPTGSHAYFAPDQAAPVGSRSHTETIAPVSGGGLIDLSVSELCDLAIAEKTGSLAWGDSARRNARLISNIFIAINGDLFMSQIEQRHLLAVRAHLDIMPAVWGKSAADKAGGFPAVFERGKTLAAIWKADAAAAKMNKTPKVGLTVTTFNRHILTLKQLFDIAIDQQNAEGVRTHIAPMITFRGFTRKDHRRQNALKPVPTRDELDLLLRSPLQMGCAAPEDRFTPGPVVIHDSGYWMPLILCVYGPRSNEFCQMPLSHVIDNASVPYFRISEWEAQSVKTPATNRDLPIAPMLIELGFLDYVQALRERGEWWLFPELNRTKEKPRKVFMDDFFAPLLEATFPNGTSMKIGDKDIDTQSIRKFLTSFLRRARPKIDLGDRQYFFGHQRKTTLEGIYEADPTVEELLPCVLRTQQLIAHLRPQPLSLR